MSVTGRGLGPVRMLLVGPVPPPTGGISVHLKRLSAVLGRRGILHDILDESKRQTVGVRNVRRMFPWSYLGMFRGCDLVHIHSSNHYVRLFHTIVARSYGLRVVQTVHSARGSRLALTALRASSRLSHRIIGVSQAVANAVGTEATVIPAFIAPIETDEPPLPTDVWDWLEAQSGAGRLVMAANASHVSFFNGADLYGIDMIVQAFESVEVRSRYSAIICLSREGPAFAHLESLRQIVETAGLGDVVKFVIGEVSFPAVLQRCNVFVRPTNTDGDAVSLREALWYGKPSVASDAAMRPDGTVLFRSRDVDDFVQKLLGVSSGVIAASGHYDYAESIISLYHEALSA